MTNLDMPRIGYYGKLGRDPVTGKLVPKYPLFKTYVQMYCVTMPIILLCICGASVIAWSQFWIERELGLLYSTLIIHTTNQPINDQSIPSFRLIFSCLIFSSFSLSLFSSL